MTDLPKLLRIKAGVIEMGERIAWGSDSALMREAADALEMAAPAVQGEPVAWVTADTVDGQAVNGKPRRVWWENNEGVGVPIYAAPQPVERQPTPDVAALVEALESLTGYIPLDVVHCRGDKCRELWCASCFGDEEAESYLAIAERHLKNAKSALAAHRKQQEQSND